MIGHLRDWKEGRMGLRKIDKRVECPDGSEGRVLAPDRPDGVCLKIPIVGSIPTLASVFLKLISNFLMVPARP